MKFVYGILIIVALTGLGLIAAGQAGFLAGKAPQNLGVVDGRLRPPSATPNSVTSQADMYPEHPQKAYSQIAPFTYAGDGDAANFRPSAFADGAHVDSSLPEKEIPERSGSPMKFFCIYKKRLHTVQILLEGGPVKVAE